MRDGDRRARAVGQQHRDAVCDHHRANRSGFARDGGVRFGDVREGVGIHDLASMHLPQPFRLGGKQGAQPRAVGLDCRRLVSRPQAQVEA